MPEGEWQLIVDAHGDEVVDRAPIASDFLARRPVVQLSQVGGETYPPYQFDRHKDRNENGAAYIDHAIRSRRNLDHLEKAIFILSQTDDGRRLLAIAAREKFKIVFDPSLCAEEGALGLCDYANKKIPLAEGRSAGEVALTLKHELQHMEDIGNGLSYGSTDQPRNAVFANRALESNARVSEAVSAAQFLLGSPQGPERQFRSGALFDNLFHKNPPVAKAAHAALSDAKAGNWRDFAAKVFPAYFEQAPTLAFYDKRYAKMLTEQAPDVRDSATVIKDREAFYKLPYDHQNIHKQRVAFFEQYAPSLFTRQGLTPDQSLDKLTIGGMPYTAQLRANKFNPDADSHIAITAETKPAFDTLRDTMAKILPDAGLHERLDLPVAKPHVAVSTPSPYHGQKLGSADAAFTPIVMPHRTDGHTTHDSQGRRSNALTTEVANDAILNMQSGNTEFDRLHHGVNEFFHRNRGFMNVRGQGTHLLQTGFLAPVGAFPEEYVLDLYRRTVLAAEGNGRVENALSKEEVRLFAHWKQMKDNGLDPIWIDKETKATAQMAGYGDYAFWSGELATLVDKNPRKATALGVTSAPGAMPA